MFSTNGTWPIGYPYVKNSEPLLPENHIKLTPNLLKPKYKTYNYKSSGKT